MIQTLAHLTSRWAARLALAALLSACLSARTGQAQTNDAAANSHFHSESRGPGRVAASADGWHTTGVSLQVMAQPGTGAEFLRWEGDVSDEQRAENPLRLTLDRTRAVVAVFAALPAPTPATPEPTTTAAPATPEPATPEPTLVETPTTAPVADPADAKPVTRHVAADGNHTAPYDSWETAASDIQSAIDAAADGDLILVAPGVYAQGARAGYPEGGRVASRIAITKAVTIRALDPAPGRTVIDAGGSLETLGGTRCAYIGTGATLEGFTLRGGATSGTEITAAGGGAFIEAGGRLLQCLVTGNHAYRGGGVFVFGDGDIRNSLIVSNSAVVAGAGLMLWGGGRCDDTLIDGNRSLNGGAGVYLRHGGTLKRSLILNNSFGGAMLYRGGLLDTCVVARNTGDFGGGVMLDGGGEVRNTVVMNNIARISGGGIFIFTSGRLQNVTVALNQARMSGGGIATLKGGIIQNSIISHNTADRGRNWHEVEAGASFDHTCTTPLASLPGTANLGADPLFMNPYELDLRLDPRSPCIDAGTTANWMAAASDLGGNPRLLLSSVDMGAYESPTVLRDPAPTPAPATPEPKVEPTDTALTVAAATPAPTPLADPSNPSNQTNPPLVPNPPLVSNPPLVPVVSVPLAPASPAAPAFPPELVDIQPVRAPTSGAGGPNASATVASGVRIRWEGEAGSVYTIEYSDNLTEGFRQLTTNIPGSGGPQDYLDVTAAGPSRFYRIRIQE